MAISLTLNGKPIALDVDPDMPLLWAVREVAGLPGTKFGCGAAQCGTCTVHTEGQPIRSCVTPISSVAGQHVTTIEGLTSKQAKAVQTAWVELQVPQCGYCQSGQIMSATALLEQNPHPTDAEINDAMSGTRSGSRSECRDLPTGRSRRPRSHPRLLRLFARGRLRRKSAGQRVLRKACAIGSLIRRPSFKALHGRVAAINGSTSGSVPILLS
jgi:isoquinoline 1-oxidoreductase alpha subunit